MEVVEVWIRGNIVTIALSRMLGILRRMFELAVSRMKMSVGILKMDVPFIFSRR